MSLLEELTAKMSACTEIAARKAQVADAALECFLKTVELGFLIKEVARTPKQDLRSMADSFCIRAAALVGDARVTIGLLHRSLRNWLPTMRSFGLGPIWLRSLRQHARLPSGRAAMRCSLRKDLLLALLVLSQPAVLGTCQAWKQSLVSAPEER